MTYRRVFFIAIFFLVNFCIKTTDSEFNQVYSTRDPIRKKMYGKCYRSGLGQA
jgi:hypothetical protein